MDIFKILGGLAIIVLACVMAWGIFTLGYMYFASMP